MAHHKLREQLRGFPPAPPVIRPSSNVFEGPIKVRISECPYKAVVRYTINGKKPNARSQIYTGPFMVTQDTVVKAAAFKKGKRSRVVKAVYIIREPYYRHTHPRWRETIVWTDIIEIVDDAINQ